MDLELKGKVAVVTGASAGIGRQCAIDLAREGTEVALVARRESPLSELANEIRELTGALPLVVVQNLMEPEAADMVTRQVLAHLGSAHILINAAGGSRPLPLDATEAMWDEAITLNFTTGRRLTHALLPHMKTQHWGRIINITGTSEPVEVNGANAAKAAVHAWSKGLSRVVAKDGITVNSIQPGKIFSEQILRRYSDPEKRSRVIETEIPAGYFGEPKDVAALAVFLASSQARYITGTVIAVDGGRRRFAF